MINTTRQGHSYEDKVFGLVKKLIAEKDLPYDSSTCSFHRWKSYESSDRNGEIRFENVVELFARGVNQTVGQPSLVIIFECKAYNNLVDVSEVEEFKAKLDQIKGFRTKGYILTQRGFRRGALNYARANGIGLVRFVPEEQVQFLLYHMTSEVMREIRDGFQKRAMEALLNPNYVAHEETEFGADDGYLYRSFEAMVINSIKKLGAAT
jgi:hypothetical protein